MDDNTEVVRSNIHFGIFVVVGAVISIWATFLIYIIHPDIGKEFMFGMFATWLVIIFFWTWTDPPVHYQVEELEKEIVELRKEIGLNKKGDDGE